MAATGQLAGQQALLRELAGRAEPGSDQWCTAQFWLAWTELHAADQAKALRRCTTVIDVLGNREPCRLQVDCLVMQSILLSNLGRLPDAAASGRRALALARELDYPFGQVRAMNVLVIAAWNAGDLDHALQLARQAGQIPDIPPKIARELGHLLAGVLADAGDLPAAGQACAATLTQARDAGDVNTLGYLLPLMADLELQADHTADGAAHLREAAQLALQTGLTLTLLNVLYYCIYLCAATERPADAITAWAFNHAFDQQDETEGTAAEIRRLEDALRQARQALGPDRARAAEQRGAAMSLATAAEYALMLTAPDPPRAPAAPGAAGLSARERELVTLVAQGRTDAQIADQLYISIRTVRSHLDRIRDKTGCRRRADLTRLALTEGLV